MSAQTELSSEAPGGTNESQTPSDVKSSVGKPSGRRCKSRQGDIKPESRVTHVATRGGDRGRGGQVKAGSTGGDPQPAAAAHTGQARPGTRSIPAGLQSKVLLSCAVCLRLVSELTVSKACEVPGSGLQPAFFLN